jgi:threonine/homoserine efflux transporter RhtA
MHVKMTRIQSGVTVPKGLFTLYMNVKIVTAKIFLAAVVYILTPFFLQPTVRVYNTSKIIRI